MSTTTNKAWLLRKVPILTSIKRKCVVRIGMRFSWMYFLFFNHASQQIKCVKQRKWGDVKRSSQVNKIWTRLTQPGGGVNDAAERNRYSNYDLKTGIIKTNVLIFTFTGGCITEGQRRCARALQHWISCAPHIQYLRQQNFTGETNVWRSGRRFGRGETDQKM